MCTFKKSGEGQKKLARKNGWSAFWSFNWTLVPPAFYPVVGSCSVYSTSTFDYSPAMVTPHCHLSAPNTWLKHSFASEMISNVFSGVPMLILVQVCRACPGSYAVALPVIWINIKVKLLMHYPQCHRLDDTQTPSWVYLGVTSFSVQKERCLCSTFPSSLRDELMCRDGRLLLYQPPSRNSWKAWCLV